MPWSRLDDSLDDHQKIQAISNDALAVWACALTFSNRKRTDGFLTLSDVRRVLRLRQAPESVIDELVACPDGFTSGLWESRPNGYQIHDWEQYNKTRDQLEKETEEARKRMERLRADERSIAKSDTAPTFARSSGDVRTEHIPEHPPDVTGDVQPVPVPGTRIPSPESDTLADAKVAAGAAVKSLADVRADLIKRCSAASKKGQIVGEAFEYCFHETKPNYGRLARLAEEAGGANKLITLMFESGNHWDEYGDAHDYLTRVVQNATQRTPKLNGHRPTLKEEATPLTAEQKEYWDREESEGRARNRALRSFSAVKPGERPNA